MRTLSSSNQGHIYVSRKFLVLFCIVAAIALVTLVDSFEKVAEQQALQATYDTDGVGVLLEDIERQEQVSESAERVLAYFPH